ncbi:MULTISPECIES: DUF4189 domain-containing protein [unclassified Microcoleus]|uniref:DUF4189 domain-containing protein n=1 Tax=unclassified Microcoleus TaxID=2642155 RepID=UPI002FD12AD7
MSSYLFKATHITRKAKLFVATLSTISLLGGCSLLDFSGVEVKVTDIPVGQSELKSGKIMTLTESKSIKEQGQRIKLTKKTEGQTENSTNSTAIVVAKFGNELRLIDFFVPEFNEKPQLSFVSTARSLVFMNPLFLGLPLKKQISIFQAIEKNKQFKDLVNLVSKSTSLFDENIFTLASEIALDVAIDQQVFLPETSQKSSNQLQEQLKSNQELVNNQTLAGQIFPSWEWVIPSANAQATSNNLEYEITSKFTEEGKIFSTNWPLWHGLELQASSEGIKVKGTSPIAQQILIIPAGKLQYPVTHNDYGGPKNKEQNVVGELLILPAEIGVWDGSIIKTISGGNQIEQALISKDGRWKHGRYDVILSGGSFSNRRSESQKVGAFDINLSLLAMDIFAVAAGSTGKKPIDVALLLSSVSLDCQNELALNAKNPISAFTTLMSCLSKPDNSTKIAQAVGTEDEEIIIEVLSKLFQFQGKAWEQFTKKVGKRGARVINLFDKGAAISRIGIFGKYLDHENLTQRFYSGQFNVIDSANAIQDKIALSIDTNSVFSGRWVGYRSGDQFDKAFTLRFTNFDKTSGEIIGEITDPDRKMYFQGKILGTQLNFTITKSDTGIVWGDMFPDYLKGTFFSLSQTANPGVMKGRFKRENSLKSIEGDVYLLLPYSSTKIKSTEKWGAIASASSQELGWSWDSLTREESEIRALENCQKRFRSCRSLVSFNNCAAYAGGELFASANSAGYWGTSDSLETAKNAALQGCKTQGTCKIITAFCSDGRGTN